MRIDAILLCKRNFSDAAGKKKHDYFFHLMRMEKDEAYLINELTKYSKWLIK